MSYGAGISISHSTPKSYANWRPKEDEIDQQVSECEHQISEPWYVKHMFRGRKVDHGIKDGMRRLGKS